MRFSACIGPLHRVPQDKAHTGHYRLLLLVPVDRCSVVSVAEQITALTTPPHPHLPFVYLYISLVLSDREFWGSGIVGWVFRAVRYRRTGMFIILFGAIISSRSNVVPHEIGVGGVYALANT